MSLTSPRISLEQWRALVAVVESGSYAQAAEALHKTQSTVTYAVQKIEALLGVKVLELQGRKAQLTETGRVLYRRGRALIDEAQRLEQAAHLLAQGWEPQLRLAVEEIFPTWMLLEALHRFAQEQPTTRIELFETVLGGTDEAVLERRVDLAITSQVMPGFIGEELMTVKFVCAAAPGHPLHALGRELRIDDLRQHRQLVIRDSGAQRARSSGWLGAEQRWTVSHKTTSIRAAVMGLGYAWYPEYIIREELEKGALRPLPLAEGGARHVELFLIVPAGDVAGPGTRRLAQILREDVERSCAWRDITR